MNTRGSVAFSAYAKLNFKLIVVGDKKVGKTSLILRYIKGTFGKTTSNTNAIEFYSQTVTIHNEEFALQIWDTVSQEVYRPEPIVSNQSLDHSISRLPVLS
jgi:GTPase SAR1 family protein